MEIIVPITQLIILSAVQGITEFLPISSSGHLILTPKLTAALVRFPRQITNRGELDDGFWMLLKLVVATFPVIVAGFLVNYYIGENLRSIEVIGWSTLAFGLLLLIADRSSLIVRKIEHITFFGAFVVGMFQVFALIPGASRSGVTMTAARLLGLDRQSAAHFSMLLSIPAIFGAGALKGFELYQSGDPVLIGDAFVAGGLALLFALLAISLLMAWLVRSSFTPFVIYRVLLGAGLLYYVYCLSGYNSFV